MTFIYAYRHGSRSAVALATSMNFKRIRHEGSKFKGSSTKTVVNWGSTELPEEVMRCNVLNRPDRLRQASNKRMFFEAVQAAHEDVRPRIPDWTTDVEVARGWFRENPERNVIAVVRTVLAGHSGEGIILAENVEALGNVARGTLITKYIPKSDEYRIHVDRTGQAFCIQQKRRSTDVPNEQVNWKVRNLAGGFIFARHNVNPPEDVIIQARKALNVVGLDFGAVDVIWNQRRNEAYVLEINSAPGLEGSTLIDYQNMFQRIIN